MPTILILKGLIASGKTTFAKEWVLEHPNQRKRISKDDLRDMMDIGKHTKNTEKHIIDVRNKLLDYFITNGKDVVIDDTNLNPIHIRDITSLVKSHEYGSNYRIEVKEFLTPLETCIERDAQRAKSIGKEAIMNMYSTWVDKKPKGEPLKDYYDPNLPECIICDIDGTIAYNNGHRGWYDYTLVGNDIPLYTNIDIVVSYANKVLQSSGNKLIFVSGREASCFNETLQWIISNVCPSLAGTSLDGTNKNTELLMRPIGDHRADYVIKKEIFDSNIKGKYNVNVVFDDRNEVVKMWRSLGLNVFQVAEGNF